MKSGLGSRDRLTKSETLEKILEAFGIRPEKVILHESRFFDEYKIFLKVGSRFSKIDKSLEEIGTHLRSWKKPEGSLNMRLGCYNLSVQRKEIPSPDMIRMINNLDETMSIPIALGYDKRGSSIVFDLLKIPNLIVAGTTGSGKSVLLHNIILSLLKRKAKIYLIDPKFVEFSCYSNIKSGIKIGYSVEELRSFLKRILSKVRKRFDLFKGEGCRNIKEFSEKHPFFPIRPIVVVVDEWADLVMQDKGIQDDLCRVAQIGRAAGVSIVIATQRPSSSVISGIIKANFPGRIAMRVASATDSRIILDESGAECLQSKGSGIFLDGSGGKTLFRSGYIESISEGIKKCL